MSPSNTGVETTPKRVADASSEKSNTEMSHNEQSFGTQQNADNTQTADDRIELKEADAWNELGFSFTPWRKWTILSIIFLVQTSMNFNTSLYSNGLAGISAQFDVSEQAARCGAMIFLVFYAFGCELWAPWSEEFGRRPILQLSLLFVNIWSIPVALAPNFATILVCRALGGLSTAGGSVTLGMVADLYEADEQQYAVAFIVFSSVGGSILGPIVGGFCEYYLDWKWCIWIQLIFGGVVQILHFLFVPETRTSIMLDRIAKERRASGQSPNVYGPNEIEPFRERFTWAELFHTWTRPFRMLISEPIVLTLSMLSGFADALVFMFIQSFALVYHQWGFNAWQLGLSFLSIGLGYVIACITFIPAIQRNKRQRAAHPHDEHVQYESRLYWLLYLAPCLPIGLIIFAWTSGGPPIHWIGTMVGACIIGIANYAIYMATIDYMICAYGPYSASATGGNGWARDFLAGVLTVPATPFYQNIGGKRHLEYASLILFCASMLLVASVYWVYWQGPNLRKKSAFAQSLAHSRCPPSQGGMDAGAGSAENAVNKGQAELGELGAGPQRAVLQQRPSFPSRRSSWATGQRSGQTSARQTPLASPMGSRRASMEQGRDDEVQAHTRNRDHLAQLRVREDGLRKNMDLVREATKEQ